MVIRPPQRPRVEGERDAFVRRLDAEHGKFIREACRAQGDVSAESAKDMTQRVLITAGQQFDKHRHEEQWPPKNLRVARPARAARRLQPPAEVEAPGR